MDAVFSMTECSICMEKLIKPKLLPCHHTFCLHCIETLCACRSDSGKVPCPLCRSTFNPPTGNCSKLPTNDYAEELVRVSKHAEDTEQCLHTQQDEIKAMKSKQKHIMEQLQCAQKRYEEAKIEVKACVKGKTVTEASLTKEKQSSQKLQQQLQKVQRETSKQLEHAERRYKEAKVKAESCQSKMDEAEASLAKEKNLCQKLRQQLQQMEQETSKQLEGAERRYKEAEVEAKSSQNEWIVAKQCLAAEKEKSHKLYQQLQQMQRETCKQLEDAKRRYKEVKYKAKACENDKNVIEASLAEEKEKIEKIYRRMQQMQRETNKQLEDAERMYKVAKDEAETCQHERNAIEASLAEKIEIIQKLYCRMKQMQQETNKQLEDSECRHKEAKVEAETFQIDKKVLESSLTEEKETSQRLHQQIYEMQEETSKQLEDAERRCKEAKMEAETFQSDNNVLELSLTEEKETSQKLHQQIHEIQQETSKQLEDAKRRWKEANNRAEKRRKAKKVAEQSLAEEKQKAHRLQQTLQRTEQETEKNSEQTNMLKTELDQSKLDIASLNNKHDTAATLCGISLTVAVATVAINWIQNFLHISEGGIIVIMILLILAVICVLRKRCITDGILLGSCVRLKKVHVLDSDLRFPICMEVAYFEFLPCLHTFCVQCIEESCRNESGGIRCPVCWPVFHLSDGYCSLMRIPVNICDDELDCVGRHAHRRNRRRNRVGSWRTR